MLKTLKNWDEKLEKVVSEIDRAIERITPAQTDDKTREERPAKQTS